MKFEILVKSSIMLFLVLFLAATFFLPRHGIAQVSAAGGSGETMTVQGRELEAAFKAKVLEEHPLKGARITVEDFKTYPAQLILPVGEMGVSLELLPNHNMLGRVAGILTVRVNGQYVRQMRATAIVEAYLPVVCAATPLAKGHVISQADISVMELPVSRLPNSIVIEPDKVVGMSLKYSVRQGQPISDVILSPPKLVKKGGVVTIIAQSSTISVSAPGEAKQDGAKNELIKVKNLMSQREITARVVNENTVAAVF
ncbi:MAG: flagellar basal body P-ring formation chaperone FlgA [Dissulfuribacterales bacterium]